jgi:malonate decarboxylase gamma subunit
MNWQAVAEALFGSTHGVHAEGDFLAGTAAFEGQTLAVIGSTNHASIGYALALRQARAVLDTVTQHPGRALLLLIDTQGQRLRRHDELLGIHRAMAHLGCCIDLARRRGHRVIGLVYDQALSGGFISSGLIADACHALPRAEIRVMGIPAMARVTKLPEALLLALSQNNPVFAPGVENYVRMGGVASLWGRDGVTDAAVLADGLRAALATASTEDRRAEDGRARGGRRLAAEVVQQVLAAD